MEMATNMSHPLLANCVKEVLLAQNIWKYVVIIVMLFVVILLHTHTCAYMRARAYTHMHSNITCIYIYIYIYMQYYCILAVTTGRSIFSWSTSFHTKDRRFRFRKSCFNMCETYMQYFVGFLARNKFEFLQEDHETKV